MIHKWVGLRQAGSYPESGPKKVNGIGNDNSASVYGCFPFILMPYNAHPVLLKKLHQVAATRTERRQPVKLDYFRIATIRKIANHSAKLTRRKARDVMAEV